MFTGDVYAEAVDSPAEHAQAAECAALAKEFPGWAVTWTTTWGYEAVRGEDRIGPCTSYSAIRCLLAVKESCRTTA